MIDAADRRSAGRQHNDQADQRSYQFTTTQIDADAKPILDRADRMSRLSDTLAQHNPQADALIGPELLTSIAGGQGSGLRMNEAEIARIVGGRSAWENLKANLQHWSLDPKSARSITPEQDRQIRALVGAVHSRVLEKQQVIADARARLVDAHDPQAHRQILSDMRQKLTAVDSRGTQEWTPPQGAPAAPKEDGKLLRDPATKEVKAKSQGGQWVQP